MRKQIYIYESDTYQTQTGHILKNMGKIKGTPNFRIKYQDVDKPDLLLNEEQIRHYLNFGSWVKKPINL